ncbi:MAG TPA: XRE family transcriptional regulator [Fibrobacteres bacterium]|jgi:HTH-type transcriptional regulator / antitoxin HipB|nr:XRE family transcriptional regulator [Fibrobacterota bacterium]
MKTLKAHLNDSLKNEKFKELYEEEKELLNVSLKLQKAREQAGFSQKELAEAAHLTQQQVSKIENGENCNILTYLKASRAIGLNFSLVHTSKRQLAKV